MKKISPRSGFVILSLLYFSAVLPGAAGLFLEPSPSGGVFTAADLPFLGLLGLHVFYGLLMLRRGFPEAGLKAPADVQSPGRKQPGSAGPFFGPEMLLACSLLLFLFSYIFATNANLDYVQRFIAGGGNLRLALNTRVERTSAALRFAPFLLLNTGVYLFQRRTKSLSGGRDWFLPLVLVSVFIAALALPSFAFTGGLGFSAWFCLIPLLMVLYQARPGRAIFYGTLYGTLTSTLVNYWLGTFSLVSLQIIILIQLVYYFGFMLVLVPALKIVQPRLRFALVSCLWALFEYVRSLGFLGYPWGLLGASQYAFTPIIQVASLTGVWGLSFLVVLVNAAATDLLLVGICGRRAYRLRGCHPGDGGLLADLKDHLRDGGLPEVFRRFPGPIAAAVLVLSALVYGGTLLVLNPPSPPEEGDLRIALIQQNSDPRKHDYRETFDSLVRLTDAALPEKPDLVVWSETAFVPNIRRWSQEDPALQPLAALVRDFLSYQRSLGTWLVTGNDDYDFFFTEDGKEERLDYNAAVLFSPEGERIDTYHKIHLVPFTEYFPYKKSLPGVYQTLLAFDVHFWEPGDGATVFRHPRFSFSTPICFEDVFPALTRRFVRGGADLILNLSNDYWSLTEAEAMQHAVHGLFRAVENRRPLLRATASGLTMEADAFGRMGQRLPFYEEGFFVARPRVGEGKMSLYTRWGDWFPLAAALGAAIMLVFFRRPGSRRQGHRGRRTL